MKLLRWLAVLFLVTILGSLTYARMRYDAYVKQTRENMALRSIEMLQVAETKYKSDSGRFATSLGELGPPPNGIIGASAPMLISKNLANGRVWGYSITLASSPTGFTIRAVPEVSRSAGRYTFYSDETLVIRQESAPQLATAASPPIK